VTRLRTINCMFTLVDDKEISLDEIVEQWAGSKQDAEKFRFQATLYRKACGTCSLLCSFSVCLSVS
jgi:hypothetical protein